MTELEAIALVEKLLDWGRLTTVQKIVFSQSWEGKTYLDMAVNAGYDNGYIKDVGSELWLSLSKVLNEKVTKNNLHGVLKRFAQKQQEAIAASTLNLQPATNSTHWGEAIDVSKFYGRTAELETLSQWIFRDRCQMVTLLGLGGMGKTALSVKLAQQIQAQFDFVIWRSLRDAPTLEELLNDLIKFLSQQQDITLPQNTGLQISRLIEYLRSSRCLIVLDNFDAVLASGQRAGYYREGYDAYGELLHRIGEIPHQSCLLLTSREKPAEVAALSGEMLPVRSLSLSGVDAIAGQELLTAKGLLGKFEETSQLINCYHGNPLALKIAATSILDLFEGDITEFLQQQTTVFNGIRNLLERQMQRLSTLEEQVMYWIAINREPTSPTALLTDIIPTISRADLLESLESLRWRSLIEYTVVGYTQQPVIMEYMSDSLINQIDKEIRTGKIQFLNRFALVKANAKEYIIESQKRIFLAAIATKLIDTLRSESEIEQLLTQLIPTLRENYAVSDRYAGGNLINLFIHLKIDLTGYDFSRLTLWQADLRGINLQQVNFSHCNLDKSIFSETLGGVLSVAISAKGELFAAGDTNGEIRVWQTSDGKQVLKLDHCTSWVWSVAFSPDGNLIACCDDKTVKVWDLRTQKLIIALEGHSGWIYQVAFSPDGSQIASASTDATIKLWDVKTSECLHTLEGHEGFVFSVAFSPDSKTLASGSHDRTVRLWNVQTGEYLKSLEGHDAWVWSVVFSPDGKAIASGSHDQTVKLWDLTTDQCLKTLQGHQGWIWSLAFSPDGQLLASSSEDQTIRLWDCQSGNCLNVLQGHRSRIWSVAFSPTGEFLASGSEDQSVRLWDMQWDISKLSTSSVFPLNLSLGVGQCRKQFNGATNLVWSVAFNPNGQYLASGSEDRTIRVWNLVTGECVQTLSEHSRRIWSVAYSPIANPEHLIASSSDDHTIKLWQPSTGKCLQTLHGHLNWVNSVTFSPNGTLLASGGGDNTVKLWDVQTGKCLHTFEGHSRWVWSVAFDAKGQVLASASGDGTIKLWHIKQRECIATIPVEGGFVSAIAFSSTNGFLAASCGDTAIRIWDVSLLLSQKEHTQTSNLEKSPIQLIHTLWGHSNRVWTVAFEPQGRFLASGGDDCQIKVWDLQSSQCYLTLQGHQSRIQSLSFSCQETTLSSQNLVLASGSYDETIKLWDLESGNCIKTLQPPRLYEELDISEAIGLTNAQIGTLKVLGAIHT
jgi:WD40 repeat protein